jgi:hypothetical protein
MTTARRTTRQVPAHALDVGDVCEFGTIAAADVANGTMRITTENGQFRVTEHRLPIAPWRADDVRERMLSS